MKTRQGFVSNSSSSSFCIYGTSGDEMEMDSPEMLGKVRAAILSGKLTWEDNYGDMMDDGELTDWINDDPSYILEEALGTSLSIHNVDGYVYVGASPESIEDDETGAQFKARVKAELELLGIKGAPSWMLETYYS